jgi:membrane protease YdiL (CAAX protease family)
VVAVVLTALTVAVLIAFQYFAQPDLSDLAKLIPVDAIGSVPLAWLIFSILNALLEELIFRGILYGALTAEWSPPVAIGATAFLFGVVHLYGYPPGIVGGILAAGFGLALGWLRWASGGLGLAIACHVCADAAIFGIIWRTGAWQQ